MFNTNCIANPCIQTNPNVKCYIYYKKPKCLNENNSQKKNTVNDQLPYIIQSIPKKLEIIPSLFNTGVDNNKKPLPTGSIDPHYILITGPGLTKATTLSVVDLTNWKSNDEFSQWLGIPPHPNALPGDYQILTTFNLQGFDIKTVSLKITCLVDNSIQDILINNNSTGLQFSSYNTWSTEVVISKGFIQGLNTLKFLVNNGIAGRFNPSGLRVVIKGIGSYASS